VLVPHRVNSLQALAPALLGQVLPVRPVRPDRGQLRVEVQIASRQKTTIFRSDIGALNPGFRASRDDLRVIGTTDHDDRNDPLARRVVLLA
jgi:hypothetical protein